MADQTNVIFVGAGAVGCFYASRLHSPERGIRVSLIARSNYAAVAAHGVTFRTHSFGDYHFTPESVFPSVANVPSRDWHYVVVTTKALPDYNPDEASLIAPLVGPRTCIVLIQNGFGIESPYRAAFPDTPLVSGVTAINANQVEPGVVKQLLWTRLSLGPYVDGKGDTKSRLLAQATEATRFLSQSWGQGGIRDMEACDEMGLQIARWHKLSVNAAFSPSGILCGGLGPDAIQADDELREHASAVMRELQDALPRVLDISKSTHESEMVKVATPERVLASTARNVGAKPSMLLDWEAGRPMELEAILGNPIRVARQAGVELPRTQAMYALLRSAHRLRDLKMKQSTELKGSSPTELKGSFPTKL